MQVTQGDGLPSYLCLDCLDTMNYAHQFKKECLRIDACLRQNLLMRNKHKTKKSNNIIASKESKNNNNVVVQEINKKLTNKGSAQVQHIKVEKVDGKVENEDEDCYYVVIINEDGKGEKTMQAVKVENPEDDSLLKNMKNEQIEVVEEGEEVNEMEEFQDSEDVQGVQESSANVEEDGEDDSSPLDNADDGQSDNIELQEIPLEEPEDTSELQGELQMEEGRLNLIQVLSGNGESIEGNVIEFSDYVSTELAMSEDGMAYTEQEVIVGNGEGDYEIICNGSEINDDEEETIAVMQQMDGSFLCDCGEAFMDFGDYETHTKTHNVFACSVCNRGFESKEIVQGHMLLHTTTDPSISCPFCLQFIKRNMITTHIKINHNQARPSCSVCDKSFANEHNLKRHMVIHSGEKKYECDICGKRFNQKVSMQNHRVLHSREDCSLTLKCQCCQRLFSNEAEVLLHDEEGCEPAADDKPFSCVTCGKQYLTLTSLRSHIEYLHNNPQMELLCPECGEVLPSRKAMYSHAYTHKQAKVKNLKRFACSTCGKGCSSHAMLLMHERVHTNERPYKCTKCTLAFKTKTHLTTHQLTHTQEKRFGCSVCMKFFALKGNLVVHLRTHTGERPYVCSICNQAFIDSKYLKKHKQRRHDMANMPWNQYY